MILCNADLDLDLRVDVMLASARGDHKLVGSGNFTLQELVNGKKDLGPVQVEKFLLQNKVNFMEYIFGGLNLNLHVAIDFTGSNGDPFTDRTSLHNF